ncbi:MAG TPA: FAD:protein FMN transferase [Clostridiales bacterium]|nr:FAD:protein FMN transferase [Clostridiales bacterium]HRT82395.1 FAD:protein FMN transferase [Oscillospiraceae bacterium]
MSTLSRRERISRRKNIRAVIAAILAIAVLSAFFIYDYRHNSDWYSHDDIVMGTVVSVKLKGQNNKAVANDIVMLLRNLEYKRLSWRVADTYLAKINAKAGTGSFEPDEETLGYIKDTLEICEASGGALDISLGELTRLWDFDSGENKVPPSEEINYFLPFVNFRNIKIEDKAVSVGQDQAIDMGAVGKGIACDEAYKLLKGKPTKSAIISVGGSVLLYNTGDVKVGIRKPDGAANEYMGILTLKNCNISTSGNYEKAFEQDGKKYHHILDPKTGYPVDNNLTSVTVVCKDGLMADALSTACFVLGYEKSLELLDNYNAKAVFISKDGSVRATHDLDKKLTLTDSNYRLVGAEG